MSLWIMLVAPRAGKRWREELFLLSKDAFPGSGFSRDQEVAALKRELPQLKKERDFLREAEAYLARRSQ